MQSRKANEEMTARYTMDPALEEIQARVEKLPHLMRGSGDWYQAVHRAIDLLEHPNNLDALWVWSRFLQAFGRFQTWKADECLSKLAFYERMRQLEANRLAATPRRQWLKRRKLAAKVADGTRNVQVILDYILTNDKNWADRQAFEAHRGNGKVAG
jgi:hypothetical protein